MKKESKFWQQIKKNTPKIQWTRLESWSSFGTPDLLGYHYSCGFFMCEMKIARGPKIVFSPHQKLFHQTRTKRNFIIVQDASLGHVKLYESSAIRGLLSDHRETPCLARDDWDHIQRLLLDACSLPLWARTRRTLSRRRRALVANCLIQIRRRYLELCPCFFLITLA